LPVPGTALYAAIQFFGSSPLGSRSRQISIIVGATGVTNSTLRARARTHRNPAAVILLFICPGIVPAMAAVDFSAGAAIGAEHDSNPFGLSDDETPPATGGGSADRDDTSIRMVANVAAALGSDGPTRLQLQGQYSQIKFNRLDVLNHKDYGISGSLDWKPGEIFDASLQASQNRAPVEQADVGTERAAQQTTTQSQGTFRLRPTPRWQLGLAPSWTQLKLPLPGAGDFRFHSKTGVASVDYLGGGQVVPGLVVMESRGRYSGVANPTRFQQQSIQATLTYKTNGLSEFSLFAGHTERTTRLIVPAGSPLPPVNSISDSGFSGSLNYRRQLSVKTGIHVTASRYIQQYDIGVGTATGTGFSAGLTWKATARISATIDLARDWATVSGTQVTGATIERKDDLRSYSLGVDYAATRLLSLRTYATRRVRTARTDSDQFSNSIAGLQLVARFD
jgi:hypothetical protein